MNDDTVQFLIVVLAQLLGIGADSVERDDDITVDGVALPTSPTVFP